MLYVLTLNNLSFIYRDSFNSAEYELLEIYSNKLLRETFA